MMMDQDIPKSPNGFDMLRSNPLVSLQYQQDADDPSGSVASPPEIQTPISSEQLGQDDTKMVNRSKKLVYFVLFLSATACSLMAYFFMENEDRRWYTNEVSSFQSHSEKSLIDVRVCQQQQ